MRYCIKTELKVEISELMARVCWGCETKKKKLMAYKGNFWLRQEPKVSRGNSRGNSRELKREFKKKLK